MTHAFQKFLREANDPNDPKTREMALRFAVGMAKVVTEYSVSADPALRALACAIDEGDGSVSAMTNTHMDRIVDAANKATPSDIADYEFALNQCIAAIEANAVFEDIHARLDAEIAAANRQKRRPVPHVVDLDHGL